MQFHESTNIDTPEGVALELTLAGLGTRMMAQLLDGLIRGLALIALMIAFGSLFSSLFLVGMVVVAMLGYEIAFETLWSGQTPGKRANQLRVVRVDGSPVTFTNVAVRNVMRLVDILPIGYAIGAVMVLVTKKHQRLGDLAAGTIVVRELNHRDSLADLTMRHTKVPAGFDATMVDQEHLALSRLYLDRRAGLDGNSRGQLAAEISSKLAPMVVDPTNNLRGEKLIEMVVAAKSGGAERR